MDVGASSVSVDVDDGTASVHYTSKTLVSSLLDAIQGVGLKASLEPLTSRLKQLKFNVMYMTCQSCVKTITQHLNGLIFVEECVVSLENATAILKVDYQADPNQIIAAIQDCGFDATVFDEFDVFSLHILHMTCQSCVSSIERAFDADENVFSATVDLQEEMGTFKVKKGINSQYLISKITDMGFEASLEMEKSLKSQKSLANTLISTHQDDHYFNEEDIPLIELKPRNIMTRVFLVKGMTCASCVATIERHLNSHPGISNATVNLSTEQATIDYWMPLTEEDIIEMIEEIGFEAQKQVQAEHGYFDLQIFGMTCASCSGKIEREIMSMKGVISATVNLLGQSGRFQVSESIGVRDLITKIEELGFNATIFDDSAQVQLESLARTKEIKEWQESFWTALSFALPISVISMILPVVTPNLISQRILPGLFIGDLAMLLLCIPVQFGIGSKFTSNAVKALKHNSYTMDVLIALGTLLSFTFSVITLLYSMSRNQQNRSPVFFETAAFLNTFVSFGRYLENSAKAQTSSALSQLMKLAPSYAILLTSDGEQKIPTEYIKRGDLLKVLPGQRVPADGIVEFGSSNLDESLLTGEPLAVTKNEGDNVIAGSVNGTGVLHIRANRIGTDTTLSQIVKLVTTAQASKSPMQAAADKVATIFVPAVIGLGVFTLITWILVTRELGFIPSSFPSDSNWLFVSLSMCISVIVVACPCALGLATPTAVMVGTGVGAKLGILIKGGDTISIAKKVTTVIFDKTGTLTFGKMQLIENETFGDLETMRLFQLIGLVEQSSEHPIGKCLVEGLNKKFGLYDFPDTLLEFAAVPGSGVEAKVLGIDGGTYDVLVGNLAFLGSKNITLSDSQKQMISKWQGLGHTVVCACVHSKLAAMFSLADTLRPESKLVIRELQRMGYQTVMVTGDQETTAKVFADELRIRKVYAGVSPQGKRTIVKRLQEQGQVIVMVGDGINDSASLAQSDIGIAVYGGTDVAIEAAAVVLMRADLTDVVTAIDLAKTIHAKIWSNFIWASVYNLLMIPMAMGVLTPWGK